jgi:SAM-dependent methyltransferase
MELTPEYLAENDDVVRRSTIYAMQGHDPDKYGNLVEFARPYQTPCARILSVGCSGFEPKLYNATHAIDIVPVAGALLAGNGWSGEFILGSCTALPWQDKFFDCAICSEVIEHLPTDEDVLEAFREINRVAYDWLITTPASPIPEATHKRFWDIDTVTRYARMFGATVVRVNLWYFIVKSAYDFVPLDIPATSGPNATINPGAYHV